MELTTDVATIGDLEGIEPYDSIYLGMPYCWDYEGNLISNFEDLELAVEKLRKMGKRVYLTTFAAPRNRDLQRVFRIIDKASELDVNGVETANLGVARYVVREYDLRVHIHGLANVYTKSTAELLYSLGISRIMPAYELPIEDIRTIKEVGVEVEIVVHGKIPLGIGHECFLKRFESEVGIKCPKICKEDLWFKSGDLILKPLGIATLSGKDVCMYEHVEKVSFVDALRVESLVESSEYRRMVGEIYRRRLSGHYSREDFEELMNLAGNGICNGFYFNRAGREYIGVI